MSTSTYPQKIICVHCGNDPGPKNRTDEISIWNGFFDKDTREAVCWDCQDLHYEKKNKTSFKHLHHEIPVLVRVMGQLELKF